jgi:hypothetical protein
MLSFCRRLMVALLAIALTSQLVQGQLLLCEQMDMGSESMTSTSMAAGHEQHEAARGAAVSAGDEAQTPSPDAARCVLAASCTTTPAVLSHGQSLLGVDPGTTLPPALEAMPHLRASRPDLPPPRA